MKKKEITICLPCYNSGHKILETFNSINNCVAFKNIEKEYIFVDDGSTDNTELFINEIIAKDTNSLKIKNDTNLGLGYSIRKAIKISNAKYFMWLPSDNDIPINTIEKVIESSLRADIVLLYIINKGVRSLMRNVISHVYNLIHMVTFREYMLYLTSPGIYNCELLKSLQLISNRFGIISELNIKMYFISKNIIQLPFHIINGENGSNSIKMKNIIESIYVYFRMTFDAHFLNKINLKHKINFVINND